MSQMQIHLHNKEINSLSGQTLVVFSKANTDKTKPAKITHPETAKALQDALSEKTVSGALCEALSFREARFLGFKNVMTLGLGVESKLELEGVRQAGAALCKELKALKTTEVFVHLDGVTANKKDLADYTQALVEGIQLNLFYWLLRHRDEQKLHLFSML